MVEKNASPGTSLKELISRREFFAALVPVLSVPAIFWLILTAKRSSKTASGGPEVTIAGEIAAGMSIQQGVILVRRGDNIRAFEARCTHLGCKLSKIEGKEVVCPCHGSRFNMEGKPVNGPAAKSLKELMIRQDTGSKTIIIR
ncbi:MAG: Rieske (2Fe-2S) protein [Bacteroidales bacterium]|nr:Rieske (2Fe-2S) protein [Bacteroidales bacterium]